MSLKRIYLGIAALLLPILLLAGTLQKETRVFNEVEGVELQLDIYKTDSTVITTQPCLLFVFGGGFKEGTRDASQYHDFFHYFTNKGFIVVSIDYRLGMKGKEAPGLLNFKPLQQSIEMAVSDLYAATNYLIEHADELNIDPEQIIISGSSAGAITVLQADYLNCNKAPLAVVLPDDFHYAGVISFSGGIFSTEGLPTYRQQPAPTLFFHGSGDKLVPYDKIRFFKLGMFGSKSLTKRFRDEQYPHVFYIMEDIGHEVSEYPMREFLPEIEYFINNFVFEGKQWMMDVSLKDMLRKSKASAKPSNYYK
jgi:predicted esterase